MTDLSHQGRAPRPPLWRNAEVRSLVYQAIILSLVILAGYAIFRNTQANLAARGISSGFEFLSKEAGFPIGETTAIPRFEGGFVYFIASIAFGLAGAWGIGRWAKRQGKVLGEDARLVLAVVGLLFVIPALVLYFTGGTIQTDTFDESKAYSLALWTGLVNTFKVAILGCVLATFLGLLVGLSRLSSNWLVAKLAGAYIEVVRNIPLLLQIFFWYHAVLRALPSLRDSVGFGQYLILNNRGVYLPEPHSEPNTGVFWLALLAACVGVYFRARQARIRRDATGEQIPVLYPGLGLLIGLPALVWLALGQPYTLTFPELRGFNFEGGTVLTPEYAALLFALVMYTGAFIAEIVRSGIQAVSKGQLEAAAAVGLRGGHVMRLVVLPQALRVIIPPLTSQYLNLAKNSSLAVAIGFPDIVSVGGTILNQSGQAIEIIGIWMAVYLTISLVISMFMNWYNSKVKLVER